MKKYVWLLVLALCLTGCAKQETFETVNDEIVTPAIATMQQTLVELPEGAASTVMETDGGRLYFCGDYTVSRFVTESGDLEKTVKGVSGFSADQLQIMQTNWGETERYDFVWTAAAETGQQLCRACILDDGNYHYILVAAGQAEQAGHLQEAWVKMFDSFRIVSGDFPLDIGS